MDILDFQDAMLSAKQEAAKMQQRFNEDFNYPVQKSQIGQMWQGLSDQIKATLPAELRKQMEALYDYKV